MIKLLLSISLGGLVGTLLRFATGLWLTAHWPRHGFVATLLVNLIGCLAIGYLYAVFAQRPYLPVELRTGLMVGLLGGFTTFSSFSLDTLKLLESGQLVTAAGYLGLSVLGGLIATWLGLSLGRL